MIDPSSNWLRTVETDAAAANRLCLQKYDENMYIIIHKKNRQQKTCILQAPVLSSVLLSCSILS